MFFAGRQKVTCKMNSELLGPLGLLGARLHPRQNKPYLLHLPLKNLVEIAVTSKSSEITEYSRVQNDLPPSQSSSFSRGASSHVAASLFRYQGRIVRIDCIRAQLLVSLPLSPVTRT